MPSADEVEVAVRTLWSRLGGNEAEVITGP
jgi:hypothetical protein